MMQPSTLFAICDYMEVDNYEDVDNEDYDKEPFDFDSFETDNDCDGYEFYEKS
jgi:hypothetical protein